MIRISGKIIDGNSLKANYPPNSIENKIIDILAASEDIYRYDSEDILKFELKLRSGIVTSARDLNRSRVSFKVFRKSKCNTDFWDRDGDGGFSLKDGVRPSDAIRDIFINGGRYGTECATAMVIIYYKALLNVYPDEIFNELFPRIRLMNWHDIDRDLAIMDYRSARDYLPGDCRYFKNPDVNPSTPEWQGENVIDLGNDVYYGHGIGIRSSRYIINALNAERKSGATESAYLLDSVIRQNYRYLASKIAH